MALLVVVVITALPRRQQHRAGTVSSEAAATAPVALSPSRRVVEKAVGDAVQVDAVAEITTNQATNPWVSASMNRSSEVQQGGGGGLPSAASRADRL